MSKDDETLQAASSTDSAPPQLATLDRTAIVRSNTNPRTHFDPGYIDELAVSMLEHGILQPILVRPLPSSRLQETFEDREPGAMLPTHELICGECRWRAAAKAAVDSIPVLIRHLDGLQVRQVQLVENLKRRDLHPLEEAEGFERLVNDHHLAIADIAARVGKSESYIYKLMKLLELTPECREQLYAGKLSQSTALLVARAPAYLQLQIAKDIMQPQGMDQEPMSYRQAVRHIQQHFMLRLGDAVFDIKDASLVTKAGSCITCTKNTGCSKDLFGDVAGGDTCTDPKCFDAKKVAHFAAVAKAAEAKGQKVIQGKEAKELMPNEYSSPKGYKLLDAHEYINGRNTTLRKLVDKDGPTPVVIINPYTKEAQEALPTDVAGKLIKKAEVQAKASAGTKERNKVPTKEDLEKQFNDAWQDKAINQLHAAVLAGKSSGVTVALARRIAMRFTDELYGEAANRFSRLFDVPAAKVASSAGMTDFLLNCPDSTVGPALLMLIVEDEIALGGHYRTGAELKDLPALQLLADDAGVDLKAVQDEVKAEMKRAAAERAKPAPAPKSKPTKKAAAPNADDAPLGLKNGTMLDPNAAWPFPTAPKARGEAARK